MSIHKARPEHEVAYQDLIALVAKHKDKLSAEEMLAIAANMLGKLLALQDQRTMTTEKAMTIIQLNIEHGNKTVIDSLMNVEGGNG